MVDFVTHLAERAIGTVPVVQPLTVSRFAPDPTDYRPELGLDSEAPPSSGEPDQTVYYPTRETPAVSDTPKLVPDDTAMAQSEEQDVSIRFTPPPSQTQDDSPLDPQHPSGLESSGSSTASEQNDRDTIPDTPNLRQRMRNLEESGPLENETGFRHEDRQSLSSTMPEPTRRTSETEPRLLRFDEPDPSEHEATSVGSRQDPSWTPLEPWSETFHRVEPAPTRRGVDKAPHRLVPENSSLNSSAAEDESSQAMHRSTRALVDYSPPPAPRSRIETTLEANEDMLGVETALAHPATPAVTVSVAPRIVSHQPDHQERGSRERRVLEPEPPVPTIRVAIGRIEVRAITSPPTLPARQETPARPGPPLSLDDYLKQRNGGQG